jgi:hypothetical protein
MKIRLVIGLLLTFGPLTTSAQTNKVSTHAGRKGIWVLCGDQLPKDFTYRILRQKGTESWIKLADLSFPKSKEEVQAEMQNSQLQANLDNVPLSDSKLTSVWQRLTDAVTIQIPNELKTDYSLRKASGNAWFDVTADSVTNYVYKVQMIGKKDEIIAENTSKEVSYPAKPFETNIKPLILKSINGIMVGEFELIDAGIMQTCKVFRSYYLRSGYEEIQGDVFFSVRDNKKIIQITDKTAVAKVPYTYSILPVDAAGNYGLPSPDLKAFNVADNTIIPSVYNFTTTSLEAEKAIKLSWKLKNTKDITAINIFKSATYAGEYRKVASLPATDTVFIDCFARPIETYYYTIRLSGNYEQSPTSPRIPGILKASNANNFPPQNLSLVQDKNTVTLTWNKTENDTRAYYVYRANGRNGKMEQISKLIITDSSAVSYIDTLSANASSSMYTYAVADQNTSYTISPLSEPVFAYSQGVNTLPIPHNVIARIDNKQVQIIWPNMLAESPYIQGYVVYRRAKSIDGKIVETSKQLSQNLISATVNNYTDNTTTEGMVYYYSVKTVADDQKTMSSPSLEAGITIQPNKVNEIANVRVFPSGKTVAIKWDNPIGDEIKIIKIIRTTDGKEGAEEIASLTAVQQTFSDTKVTTGSTYYYQLQVENKLGKKSKLTEAVGVKIY